MIYIYIYIYIHKNIYIYIHRERERERHINYRRVVADPVGGRRGGHRPDDPADLQGPISIRLYMFIVNSMVQLCYMYSYTDHITCTHV